MSRTVDVPSGVVAVMTLCALGAIWVFGRRKRRQAPPLPKRIPWPPKPVELSSEDVEKWTGFLASWWTDEAEEPEYDTEGRAWWW